MNQKKLKQYEATKNDPEKTIEQPIYGQIGLSDITVEGFLKQHLNTPRGLAIYADELMGFVKSFSRYRSGNDEEVWTQLFTGVPIIVNRLHSDPLGTLTEKQRSIYLDLPSVFTTREGLSIALQHSMSERTFKDWIKTATFKKLDYGTYGKRYGIYRIL